VSWQKAQNQLSSEFGKRFRPYFLEMLEFPYNTEQALGSPSAEKAAIWLQYWSVTDTGT